MRPSLFLICPLATAFALCTVTSVRADCGLPPTELLWSYPAQGDGNVPTNAQFWLLSTGWGDIAQATLNGQALTHEATGPGVTHLTPPALSPDTDYVLAIEFRETPGQASVPEGVSIAFHSGTGAQASPSTSTVDGHDLTAGLGDRCTDVISAQDCFDTGQDTLLSFNASNPDAIGWLARRDIAEGSHLIPARCDAPALFVHKPKERACYAITAIGAGGLLAEPKEYCVSPEEGEEPSEDAGSEPAASPGKGAASPAEADTGDGPTPPSDEAAAKGCTVGPLSGKSAPMLWITAGLLLSLGRRRVRRS